jgi:hypothetical protein
MGVGPNGEVVGARLMGNPDQCLAIDWPYHRWCGRSWPHDGDHEYLQEPTTRILFEKP